MSQKRFYLIMVLVILGLVFIISQNSGSSTNNKNNINKSWRDYHKEELKKFEEDNEKELIQNLNRLCGRV